MEGKNKIKEAEMIAELLTDEELLLVMQFMSEIKISAVSVSKEETEHSLLQAPYPPHPTK